MICSTILHYDIFMNMVFFLSDQLNRANPSVQLNQQLHARDLASVIFLAFLIWQEYNLWQFFFQSPDFA